MFFVKIRVSARLPGASVLYGGGVPDAPGTLLQPHTSRRHEGMPPYIPPYKQTVGRGALTPPRRGQGLSPQSRSKGRCDPLHFSCSFVKFLRQS